MKLEELKTIEQLKQFLDGTQAVIFTLNSIKDEHYKWLQHELIRFRYLSLGKADKGVIVRYLIKVSGYSRSQITRLIKQYRTTGYIKHRHVASSGFKGKYNLADIRLLARMDERHDTPCGHAVKKLCERAYDTFNEKEFERLSNISVSHIYNLRKSKTYTRVLKHFEKTKPKASNIGIRRKPEPEGKPGFIRIDTVHQGDQNKQKGVYHINAVDEVTQFEVVCSVEKISEAYLLPVLNMILDFFPFKLMSFHSDNGSEYINRNVANLLKKLFIEFTKSRSRHSNDNALAESKNASVVRKTLGYQHMPQKYAGLVNDFNQDYLNPHINYHRPCFFPEVTTDKKGKQRKKYLYKNMMTPYDKLKSLPNAQSYLKNGISFDVMDEKAYAITDNQSADQLQAARRLLFKTIDERTVNQL
ncbi:MAG: transposase family protein [Thiomicrorhabdus sp.]|nr:transposase family protein [Thiomicrorhabdus sp.]